MYAIKDPSNTLPDIYWNNSTWLRRFLILEHALGGWKIARKERPNGRKQIGLQN